MFSYRHKRVFQIVEHQNKRRGNAVIVIGEKPTLKFTVGDKFFSRGVVIEIRHNLIMCRLFDKKQNCLTSLRLKDKL